MLQRAEQIQQDDDEITSLTNDLVTLSADRDTEIARLTDKYNEEVDPLADEQKSIDKKLDDIKFKLDHADDDICPTCGQKIPVNSNNDFTSSCRIGSYTDFSSRLHIMTNTFAVTSVLSAISMTSAPLRAPSFS